MLSTRMLVYTVICSCSLLRKHNSYNGCMTTIEQLYNILLASDFLVILLTKCFNSYNVVNNSCNVCWWSALMTAIQMHASVVAFCTWTWFSLFSFYIPKTLINWNTDFDGRVSLTERAMEQLIDFLIYVNMCPVGCIWMLILHCAHIV